MQGIPALQRAAWHNTGGVAAIEVLFYEGHILGAGQAK